MTVTAVQSAGYCPSHDANCSEPTPYGSRDLVKPGYSLHFQLIFSLSVSFLQYYAKQN